MKIKESALGLLTLCFPLAVFGQPEIPDFGDIPDNHWEVSAFEGDSSLGAIVLFDHGEIEVNSDLNIILERHIRIKILSEKGYDWATVTIPYYAEKDRQEVDRPKAVSYNRLPDGEVRSQKVGRREFYEEKVDERWEQKKFTFPAVQPGTIVEYEYSVEYEHLADFPDWSFQRSIPTLVSYLHADIPEWFQYTFFFQGVEEMDYKNTEQYPTTRVIAFNRNSARGTQRVRMDVNMIKRDWAMENIPALEEEPLMSSLNNFESKLFVQLNSINYPNGAVERVLSNWNNVVEKLNEHDEFGKQLGKSKKLAKITQEIIADAKTDFEKMQVIYDYITEKITWNDELGVLAEKSPEEVFTTKSGTGVEINLLLVRMLRDAGIKANPVILSTRGNGLPLTIFPIVAQFNHIICEANIEDKSHYLDAKSEFRPYNLLPVSDLNGDALVVKENSYRWVQLNRTAPSIESYRIIANIDKNGQLKGSVSADIQGYPALNLRAAFEEEDDKEEEEILKENWFEEYSDIELDSVRIENREAFEKVLRVKSDFSLAELSQASNDEFIYMNPMLLLREQTNPFKLEERKYPIVFPSRFKQKLLLSVILPEGIEVDELPKSKRVMFQENAGMMTRMVQVQKKPDGTDNLMLLYEIQFAQHRFHPNQYESLKKFWQDLVTTHSELVVLRKRDLYEAQQ